MSAQPREITLTTMSRAHLLTLALPLALPAVLLTACSSTSQAPDTVAPDFTPGQGQLKAGTNVYPAGPYGISVGSSIANYDFLGFANAVVSHDANNLQPVQLADFYNPHVDDATYTPVDAAHDDRLFPPGSALGAGQPKPRVLLIDVGSVWCPPCNDEAKTVLPAQHAKYAKCGGGILEMLADGPTPGTAATPAQLVAWTTKYKVDFPSALDPASKLNALFSQDAFPANIIVDTRTMKIVESINGEPDPTDTAKGGGADFWKLYEKTLNNPTCLAGG